MTDVLQFIVLRSSGQLRARFCTVFISFFNISAFILALTLMLLMGFWSDFGGPSDNQVGMLCAAALFSLILTIGKFTMTFEDDTETLLMVEEVA